MNIQRKKSQRWFLENEKTKQTIRLFLGDTKIRRQKISPHNTAHCIIDIFKDRTIKIQEIVSKQTITIYQTIR